MKSFRHEATLLKINKRSKAVLLRMFYNLVKIGRAQL